MKSFLCVFSAFLFISPALALWPRPQNLTTGSTPLRLASNFLIQFSDEKNAPGDLQEAVQRTTYRLKNDKLQALVVDRGASSSSAVQSAKTLSSLTLTFSDTSSSVSSLSEDSIAGIGNRDESYNLDVPDEGNAVLTAKTALGMFRGLMTFEQLWYELNNYTYTLLAPIKIEDYPKYPYRGLMLDTSRNYFGVDDIKRTLDAMSWVKINHFHWHMTDAQSFPLVVPGFEELADKGAYSRTEVYTAEDVKDITAYAAKRGIDVIIEIDTPGHTSSISKSHPEHIACPEATPWAQFANESPAGQLRVTSPDTVNFTANLIKAIASMVPSSLLNTGGDEINANCYQQDNQTQSDLSASGQTLDEALASFVGEIHEVVREAKKTPVVWEEIPLDHNVPVKNDTIVLVWVSEDSVEKVAEKGLRIIHAASDYFYLDCGAGGWVGNNVKGNSWCDPFKTWQKSYSFDPTNGTTPDQAHLVLGGQQLLWTEQSSASNLDPMLWPRAAASAEVFWSGPNGNVSTALPRLHDVAYRFLQRGVKAIPLQPRWCALRPGVCDINA